MEHFWQNIDGYLDHFELYDLALSRSVDGSKFIEIGTYKGRSAAYMAVEIENSKKQITLDTIDHYSISNDNSANSTDQYETVLRNLDSVKHIVKAMKMKSADAAELYENNSLDFVYIDASHDYESVKEDILSWYDKVKIGGIIGGDDFGWPGVESAVLEIIHDAQPIGIKNSNWYYIKK